MACILGHPQRGRRGQPVVATGADGTLTTGSSGASVGTTSTASSSSGDAMATAMLVSGGSETGGELPAATTTTGGSEPLAMPCDVANDACPEGQKCVPYSRDFGALYPDEGGCFTVVEGPDPLGETCAMIEIVDGDVVALDSCERGQVCSWRTGTCLALCQGPPDAWTCPFMSTCTGWEIELLCWPICDPLDSACPAGERCNLVTTAGFQCYPESDEDLPLFSACPHGSECAAGSFCGSSEEAVECDPAWSGCCNKLCDLDGDTCPGVGQLCVPFGLYVPIPGYEDLGRCALPMP
jgi:hypothetical protein